MKIEQLCWKCENANAHKCSWFFDFTYPKSVLLKDGFIVKCDNFVVMKNAKIETNEEQARKLGVSVRTFYRMKKLGLIK